MDRERGRAGAGWGQGWAGVRAGVGRGGSRGGGRAGWGWGRPRVGARVYWEYVGRPGGDWGGQGIRGELADRGWEWTRS